MNKLYLNFLACSITKGLVEGGPAFNFQKCQKQMYIHPRTHTYVWRYIYIYIYMYIHIYIYGI